MVINGYKTVRHKADQEQYTFTILIYWYTKSETTRHYPIPDGT